MNIEYTTFDLNSNDFHKIAKKVNSKNDYIVLDLGYVIDLKNKDFKNKYIKNGNIFKANIISFMKDMIDVTTNNNKQEILLPYTSIVQYFHPSNYTYAIDFLNEIGFMKKKIVDYNGGNIYYHIKPKNGDKGIATTYTIYPVKQFSNQFALVRMNKKTKEKQFQNFKVQLSKAEINTLKHTQLDRKAALKAEFNYYNNSIDKNINSLYKRINRILSFGEKVYTTRGDKSQRVFHNLSNLSSVSRKHLTYKGESFFNIDLKNSQILFLVAHCKQNNRLLDKSFINDVLDGLIYDRFYGAGEFGTDRKKVKQELFRTVFFDFKIKENFNIDFKKMYPLAWETIQSIHDQYKSNDKCNLAILLQNVEHDAFQNIPMISSGWFNLFDSIYCTSEADIDTIHQHLIKYFKSIGIDRFQVTTNE